MEVNQIKECIYCMKKISILNLKIHQIKCSNFSNYSNLENIDCDGTFL